MKNRHMREAFLHPEPQNPSGVFHAADGVTIYSHADPGADHELSLLSEVSSSTRCHKRQPLNARSRITHSVSITFLDLLHHNIHDFLKSFHFFLDRSTHTSADKADGIPDIDTLHGFASKDLGKTCGELQRGFVSVERG